MANDAQAIQDLKNTVAGWVRNASSNPLSLDAAKGYIQTLLEDPVFNANANEFITEIKSIAQSTSTESKGRTSGSI
jgi:hypothetical protein